MGLVLAGGGARGAYEAGALSILLPELERRGQRPTLLVGTSVGAINVAFLGATQHLSASESSAGLVERWSEVRERRVMRPVLLDQLPRNTLRYLGELLSVPGARLTSLLDPAPLARELDRWIDWSDLHDNVASGLVHSVAVVATAARSGCAVAFVEGESPASAHRSHVVDYVGARLETDHVRASAAIPILFPPVRVDRPKPARGWYFDGGTRLNTPIKPALDHGAQRLVVIGTDAITPLPEDDGRHECAPPDFGDGALHLLNGALVDPLIEDLRMLGNVNSFLSARAPGAKRYREARGKPPYREVPYLFIGPRQRGAIGQLALEVFNDRYRGLRSLRSPDLALIRRLLGRDGPAHGELLSYLFSDPEFIAALTELGADDARHWLGSRDDPWVVEPLEALVPAL